MRTGMTKEAEKEKMMIRKKRRSGFLVATICAIMGSIFLLAVSVLAATAIPETDLTLSVANLIAKYSGSIGKNGNVNVSGSGTEITAEVKTGNTGNVFKPSFQGSTAIITLTNGFASDAKLSFDVSKSSINLHGSYRVMVDGVEASEPYSFILKGSQSEENKSVKVEVTGNKDGLGCSLGVKVAIKNIKLEQIVNKTEVTFVPGQHGSYTVDGNAITAETKMAKESTEGYVVSAKADAGYSFYGWKNLTTGDIDSRKAEDSLYFSKSSRVQPVFFPTGLAVFGVGSELFSDLNDANTYANSQTSNKTIVLLQSGTLSGDATISKGNLLLIPYNNIASANASSTPDAVDSAFVTPTHFRTLTIPDGVTLTVNGDINVNGQVLKLRSYPTGPHGLITLEENGKIVLNSGANLYCWGYINGEGTVVANSGSHVYECFQLRGWRGGTVTSGMLGNKQGVFPINQYYIQNIEAELCMKSGATESVYASVTVTVSTAFGEIVQQAAVTDVLVGTDKGLFRLTSGSLSKKYNPSVDQMQFTAEGEMAISAFSLQLKTSVGDYTLDTEKYALPIHGGFSVHIKSGTTTIPSTQKIALLPGAELTVEKDATLNVNSDMFVYDLDQWKGSSVVSSSDSVAAARKYAYTADLLPVSYVTTPRTIRTAAKMTDAKVNVNGIINISGHLYTTARDTNNSGETSDGANITSSLGGGRINFLTNTKNTENTYQVRQGGDKGKTISYDTISCTTAKLLNGDGTYLETAGAKGPENGKPGWSYTYLTTDPEYAEYTDTNVYKNMWYRFKVTYKINNQETPVVQYTTTDGDTFKLPGGMQISADDVSTDSGGSVAVENGQLVLSGITKDCTVTIKGNPVYKINVSWTGNLNFEYKPNIYKWDATQMCYVREQEAGWRSENPTVTVTNDQTLGSTGNIKAQIDYNKEQAYSDLDMLFTIGDSTTPNSVTMSDKLIPGKSVTAKMQLTGAPTGMTSGTNIKIGRVALTLTTAD